MQTRITDKKYLIHLILFVVTFLMATVMTGCSDTDEPGDDHVIIDDMVIRRDVSAEATTIKLNFNEETNSVLDTISSPQIVEIGTFIFDGSEIIREDYNLEGMSDNERFELLDWAKVATDYSQKCITVDLEENMGSDGRYVVMLVGSRSNKPNRITTTYVYIYQTSKG